MTIFALATAPGRAAIAVIRVSGPAAGETVRQLSGKDPPAAGRAVLRRLQDGRSGDVIDQALVLWFPGPASVTGEDVAEFHVHGGRAVVHGVLDALASVPGVRPAEPGEFTRWAVLNGKMDLVEAEAVADLVAADTSRQRHQALGQLQGLHSALYDGWRQRLVDAMARLEAVIDFPDEELPAGLLGENTAVVTVLEEEVRAHLDDGRRGERLREGLSVVILGAPNVGKSSLLNALAGNEAAIVSAEEGTTRDTVEVTMDIAGFAVSLVDTAGLREVPQGVEEEGIRRALTKAEAADLTLLVADASRWDETWRRVESHCGENVLVVAGKADLARPPPGVPGLSAKTGEGIDRLIDAMAQHFRRTWQGAGLSPSRNRHRAALLQVVDALARYGHSEAGDITLAAEDLRLAATALGRLTGRVDVEDLLDVIFSEFCIGK